MQDSIALAGKKIYETFSEEDTLRLAAETAAGAAAGDVFCLEGDLGAGKTVFARGFARGLGVEDAVTSPTFTIVNVYEDGRLRLYHFDVYRIEDEDEMYETGFEEYFYGDGVCLVEWACNIPSLIPEEAKHILIEKDLEKGMDYRRISIW